MENNDILSNIIQQCDYSTAMKTLSVIQPSAFTIINNVIELKEKEICKYCESIKCVLEIMAEQNCEFHHILRPPHCSVHYGVCYDCEEIFEKCDMLICDECNLSLCNECHNTLHNKCISYCGHATCMAQTVLLNDNVRMCKKCDISKMMSWAGLGFMV